MANYLIEPLMALLDINPGPHRLYDLIDQLREQGYLSEYEMSDVEHLFAVNFLVNNALYHLQNTYWEEYRRYLSISSLAVELQINQPIAEKDLIKGSETDAALSDYYLNWSHLEQANKASIESLLDSFWQAFVSDDELSVALSRFNLSADCSYAEVKRRYRELAMQHHPDRGGSQETFQQINQSMSVLQRRFAP